MSELNFGRVTLDGHGRSDGVGLSPPLRLHRAEEVGNLVVDF